VELQHCLMASPHTPEFSKLSSDQELLEWLDRKRSSGAIRIVEVPGGVALGYCQITEIHRANRSGWIGLAIAPEYRGMGYGRLAMKQIEIVAQAQLNLKKLMLQVRVDNDPARKLYITSGWRSVGTLQSHYFDGKTFHDVEIFEKHLNGAA
jgi:RimJ/RimL family protein N-acetyltransferase